MSIRDNPLLFSALIIVAILAQQILVWLKQRNHKIAYTLALPVILIYWVALGLVMIIGGIAQLNPKELFTDISGVMLGLGLSLSGLGQTLKLSWLKVIGVVMLSIGSIVAGIGFIERDNPLGAVIALAMGIGILLSAVRGWIGGIGQMVIGAVILGSSAMLLIGTLVTVTQQVDSVTVVIGAAMLIMGLWVIINGVITVASNIKQPTEVALPSS